MAARTLIFALALAQAARADAPAGRTVEVVVARVPRGLETGLPRGHAWARALAATRGRDYRRARDLFLTAAAEVRRAVSDGTMASARGRLLGLKAELLSFQCALLLADERDPDQRGDFERLLLDATALHNLFLTARALEGRNDPLLYERAERSYRAALLKVQPEHPPDLLLNAELAYAGLLAAGGARKSALDHLSRVPASRIDRSVNAEYSARLFILIAEAEAELGDRDRALDALETARELHPRWLQERSRLRAANEFDRLREDPRFVALTGEEE